MEEVERIIFLLPRVLIEVVSIQMFVLIEFSIFFFFRCEVLANNILLSFQPFWHLN